MRQENEQLCVRIRSQCNLKYTLIWPKCEQICDGIRPERNQTCDLTLQGCPSATKIRLSIPYYVNFSSVISPFTQNRAQYTQYFARFEANRKWLVVCYQYFPLYEQKFSLKIKNVDYYWSRWYIYYYVMHILSQFPFYNNWNNNWNH